MKYKTELIHEILEQRGHEKSTLHYQSECVKSWVDETKGAYPKLCDYESEWLNYIYDKPIGEFPYETVSTNSMTTINNVVPFEYKSAIFKGQTLVNIINYSDASVNTNANYVQIGSLVYSVIGKPITLFNFTNKVVTCQVIANGSFKQTVNINANSKTVVTLSDNEEIKKIRGTKANGWTINETSLNELKMGLMAIEGDYTNIDIPYFTGMQSVKMPVLTTYNQGNLFKNYIQDGSQWGKDYNCTTDVKCSQNGSYVKLKSKNSLCYGGFVSPSLSQGTYKFTCKIRVGSVGDSYRILIHGNPNSAKNDNRGFASDKIVSTQENETFEYVGYFNEANNILLYGYRNGQEIEYYDIIFTKLSDEDVTNDIEKYNYKTNILTVNEDVTLRSNGDVCDELDLLTGKLTQRIGEDGEVLTQEVVKTVDLTVVNQDGEPLSKIKPIEGTMHIEVSGTPIPPTAVLEVPVEAITQNLNSFIEEE